jgi:hypothetical protein
VKILKYDIKNTPFCLQGDFRPVCKKFELGGDRNHGIVINAEACRGIFNA